VVSILRWRATSQSRILPNNVYPFNAGDGVFYGVVDNWGILSKEVGKTLTCFHVEQFAHMIFKPIFGFAEKLKLNQFYQRKRYFVSKCHIIEGIE
jgi:hypothetical protein